MHPIPSHPPQGQIQVIFGPMFSGKTTELIRRCKRYQLANYRCVVVKYAKDTRYCEDEAVITHDHQKLPAISAIRLEPLMETLIEYEVIGVDEGQFFGDTVHVAEQLASKGKTVIVAALDGDFRRVSFGDIIQLVPLAESVIKLTAVCMLCFRNASYTKRISADTELEVIGGADKYIAVCRDCHGKSLDEDSSPKDKAVQTPTKLERTVSVPGEGARRPLVIDEMTMVHLSPRKEQLA